MYQKTRKIAMLAMLCALAYIVMAAGRIPIVLFLKYDPKDVVITIGGFIFGPLTSLIISTIVSLAEMFTVSDTGPIGCLMNIISTCSFACTAAYIYKKKHTISGAIIGLITGTLFMIFVMLMWNYFITPLYLGYPREAVAKMLIPVFFPFNFLKGGLNAAITMLLYKPVVSGLRSAHLIPSSESNVKTRNIGVTFVSLAVLITCVLSVLVMKNII